MWTVAYPFAFKVGISRDPKARRAQIEADLHANSFVRAPVKLLLSVPSLFREQHEAMLHRWLEPCRARVARHSGHTEWFLSFVPNAILGALLYIIAPAGFNYDKFALFALFAFAPFPFGAIVALLLLSIVEVAALIASIVFFVFIVALMFNLL